MLIISTAAIGEAGANLRRVVTVTRRIGTARRLRRGEPTGAVYGHTSRRPDLSLLRQLRSDAARARVQAVADRGREQ